MRQKVELAQVRNAGDITDDSILFFKQNWQPLLKSYFAICGFFWVAGIIIAVFNETKTFQLQEQGESVYSLTYLLTLLISFINFVFILLTTLSFVTLYNEKGNEAPGIEQTWVYFKYYFFKVFGSAVVLTILCMVGAVFCIMPGLYFMPVFLLVITVMVMENQGLSYAFSRSFGLIKNNWWQMFGALLSMMILVFAAMILLIIPVIIIVVALLYLTNLNPGHTEAIAVTATLHSLQILYLLPFISVAFMYYSLTEQKDDHSLMQRIEMIGKHNDELNQLPSEEY